LRRTLYLPLLALVAVVLAGCPKTDNQDFEAGRKAEAIQDYDTALVDYERALRSQPMNSEYKLRAIRMHSMDGSFHLEQGEKLLKKGDLEMALAEFEKAEAVDPSNMGAEQEVQRTMKLLAAKNAANTPEKINPNPPNDDLLQGPPQLKPALNQIDGLKMTNNSNVIFETIAKLAGLTVIFDSEFQAKRISVELPSVTVEQALDIVSAECKAFWKPMTSNVIFVAADNPTKRKDIEDEVVQTFYISNTMQSQDLTEMVTLLRSVLNLAKVQQVNSQNAIVIRDTPDKIAAAAKILRTIDKAKPEVSIHVQVLTASRDRLRDLGILPGQSVAVSFTPRTALQPNSGSSSSSSSSSTTSSSTTATASQILLNSLHSLGTADYSITLPGATANAIMSDNKTHIIQDPEVRVSDGERAQLKIGERVPIATGSFQAGVGVGVGGGAGVVNPLVNTQFTYQDVGVNIDVTPRVHPDGDISMKLIVDVSSLAGSESIGGINQPIITQNKIEHEVRLKDGEASILGGLISRDETLNSNGIPGLMQLPMFRYLFSDNSKETQDQEIYIILTPHIIRFPSITAEDLRSLATGSETNLRVFREQDQALVEPATQQQNGAIAAPPPPAAPLTGAAMNASMPAQAGGTPAAQLQFDPGSVSVKQGDTTTLGLKVSNINDLYSIPLLIHYNPAVIQIEEIRSGGFLGGGTQEIAIVQRIDAQRGEAVVSATRQPNTPGISGTGTLLGVVVRAVGPGSSQLQILQVNARDSQQHTIPLVSGEATVRVQ
jgi:general secretion pathway protein D